MANPIEPAAFKEALVILGAAGIVIPIFHRLKLSPVLGFMLVGMAVGPFGAGSLEASRRRDRGQSGRRRSSAGVAVNPGIAGGPNAKVANPIGAAQR